MVRSKMGTREILLSFPIQNSETLDNISEIARLSLGYTFTGTSRHFVQFRDASAPFGFDSSEIIATDEDYALYHSLFTQVYTRERDIDLGTLLLQLRLQVDPKAGRGSGPCFVLAEEGVGHAFIHYLVRSQVDATVGLLEWPPASPLDESPERRYLLEIPQLPERMHRLAVTTPGLAMFRSVAPGVAVQVGHRHPITLRACPVWQASGLVLFRAAPLDPLVVRQVPAMGPVTSFARISFGSAGKKAKAGGPTQALDVSVPLRLVPSASSFKRVTGSFIQVQELPLLRRLAYLLGPETIRGSSLALCSQGAFLRCPRGVEAIPIGIFMSELRPDLFIAAGYDAVPSTSPEVIYRALGSPSDQVIFVLPQDGIIAVPKNGFTSLETALLEGHTWAKVDAEPIKAALSAEIPTLAYGKLGLSPLRDVQKLY